MVHRQAIITGVLTGAVTALVGAWLTGGFGPGTPASRLFSWLPDADTRGPSERPPPTEATELNLHG